MSKKRTNRGPRAVNPVAPNQNGNKQNGTLNPETTGIPSSMQKAIKNKKNKQGGKGVLLLALGHRYYGEMAANLAASIKFGDPDCKIHIVYHGDALSRLTPEKMNLFDTKELCPEYYITARGQTAYFKAKTFLYELSPFTETIYLDVDMIWFGNKSKMTDMFSELGALDFTMMTRDGSNGLKIKPGAYMWGDVKKLEKAYNIKQWKWYNLHSEFIYFKKKQNIKDYFELAQEVYESPKTDFAVFAGDMADELCFAVASHLTGIEPHQTPFHPIYWMKLDSAKHGTGLQRVQPAFHAMSIGGNKMSSTEIKNYNKMAIAFGQRMGLQNIWKLIPKYKWLPERHNM